MNVPNPLVLLGRPFAPIGRYVLLLWEAFSTPREFKKYGYDLLKQVMQIGVGSLPVVILAAAFTGAVTTVQTNYQMDSPFIPRSAIGAIVTPSVVLELGVLITAFILSGRIGARIAAELGAMRVGEQIDAIDVMGLNAAGYLIVPRVVAGTLTFPVLYVAASLVGIASSILIAELSGILTSEEFIKGARSFFRNKKALEEKYNGGLGIGQLGYRWTDVQVLLNDLHEGFTGGPNAES